MTTEDATEQPGHSGSALSEGLGLVAKRDVLTRLRRLRDILAAGRSVDGYKGHAALDDAIAEIERLRAALAKANEQAERFERGWYLRGDALELAVRQNEHDMLMTGEELRACRAALGA